LILKIDTKSIKKTELISYESFDFANKTLIECEKLLTPDFIEWIRSIYSSKEFNDNLNNFIGLQKLIDDEPVGKMREKLIDEIFLMIFSLT
jgi:hypothetical protein